MIRLYFLLFSIFLFGKSFAQTPIDTVETINGPLVIYNDRTWQYLDDIGFDGILNTKLNALLVEDTFYQFVQTWDHDVCYTSDRENDLSRLRDTLWLCVLEDQHSEFYPPVSGIVTSRYGYRSGRYHNGIDLDLETGDTVYSCWSGKIRYAKFNDGGFGNLVIVRHYNGLETFYAHLSKLLVVPDQDVAAGEPIGLGGNTGRSYGSHLHFEVRFFDAPMNPEEIIDFEMRQCKDENLMVHKGLFRPGAKPTDQEEHGESATYAAVNNTNRVYYKVRSGDTLTAIAARNKTTVSKLCQLNGIRPTTTIQIGRSLRVR
jgi:hypothetical protein